MSEDTPVVIETSQQAMEDEQPSAPSSQVVSTPARAPARTSASKEDAEISVSSSGSDVDHDSSDTEGEVDSPQDDATHVWADSVDPTMIDT